MLSHWLRHFAMDLVTRDPSKFELAVNLKAAKALNLDLPAMIISQADEIIG